MNDNEKKISELEFQLYMKFKESFERQLSALTQEFNNSFRQLCDTLKYNKEFTEFYGDMGYLHARTPKNSEEQAKKEMTRLAVAKHLEDMGNKK